MIAHNIVPEAATRNTARPLSRARGLLGGAMVLAGVTVLADVAFVRTVSPAFIGIAAIVVGGFEAVHAIWTRGWSGFGSQMLLGLLYIAVGIVLVGRAAGWDGTIVVPGIARSARQGDLLLTYGLGLLLMLSGLVRILLGASWWRGGGKSMLLSGAFGILAGFVILTEFPKMGLWIFGLLLGIDIISHGLAWLGYAFLPADRTSGPD